MATARDPKNRGLPSINEARIERKRALVTGKTKVYGGTPQFWLWTALGVATFTVIYWKFAQGELESQKSALMSKQRAVAATLGPKITPFRDKIEEWVMQLAHGAQPEKIAEGIDVGKLAKGPGVYLRLRLENAKDPESIRRAAMESLRDGFTSCLFVREETRTGDACRKPSDCSMGLLCNEWGVCARPSQPYNMRLAYRAMRVLTPEWTDDLHQAASDLAVRAFELDLAAVTRNDVPLAVEVLTRARYFTAVLDEMPKGGLPPPIDRDAGAGEGTPPETEGERLQRVPHHARIGIWNLRTGEQLVRLRAWAGAEFVPVGDRVVQSAATLAAQQRQVNNCALALSVKEAIQKAAAPSAEKPTPATTAP